MASCADHKMIRKEIGETICNPTAPIMYCANCGYWEYIEEDEEA